MERIKEKILIVEDDTLLASSYQKNILNLGLKCEIATTEEEAFDKLEKYKPDLAILDIELKDNNDGGIKIAQYISEHYKIPFIYLTGSCITEDFKKKIFATNHSGYFRKPIDFFAFEINIKNILHLGKEKLELGKKYFLDVDTKSIFFEGKIVEKLSKKHFELLKILAISKNQIVPFNTINDVIYKDKTGNHTALRELIREIRKKFNFLNIETERGFGYRLNIPPSY